MAGDESLIKRDEGQAALGRALALRAEATTDAASARRADLLRDKQKVVGDFFETVGKGPTEVTPLDVEAWRQEMERLASFFSWAMRHTALGQILSASPVHLARPKAPKKYQTSPWPEMMCCAVSIRERLKCCSCRSFSQSDETSSTRFRGPG